MALPYIIAKEVSKKVAKKVLKKKLKKKVKAKAKPKPKAKARKAKRSIGSDEALLGLAAAGAITAKGALTLSASKPEFPPSKSSYGPLKAKSKNKGMYTYKKGKIYTPDGKVVKRKEKVKPKAKPKAKAKKRQYN